MTNDLAASPPTISFVNGTAINDGSDPDNYHFGEPISLDGGSLTISQSGDFVYEPHPDFAGFDSFTYTIASDSAASTAEVAIDVEGIAPVVNVPAAQTVPQDIATSIGGVSIIDASLNNVEVTLSVSQGALTFGGNSGPVISVSDTLGAINAALASGLTYQPATNYTGADDLSITVSDATTGLQASGDLPITVQPTTTIFAFAEHEYFVEPPDSTVTMEVDRSGLMTGSASVTYLSGQTVTFADQQGSADITIPLSAISMPLPLSSAGLPYFQVELIDPANNTPLLIPRRFIWLTTTSNRSQLTTRTTPLKIKNSTRAGGRTNPVC